MPELNVIDNIILPNYLTNKGSMDLHDIINKIGLSDKVHKLPGELSSGELQRAAFARAIINKPDIILADEPTGNLDKKNKVKIFDLLKDYSKNHSATILVASHDEIIREYSDEILTIEDGMFLK